MTKNIQVVKPKILTIWPLRESLPAPRLVILCLVCTIMSSLKNLSISNLSLSLRIQKWVETKTSES